MRDVLERIVYYYCQLIGEQPVGALDHEVADLAFEVLRDAALQRVIELNNAVVI
jgi:hypothetical protein